MTNAVNHMTTTTLTTQPRDHMTEVGDHMTNYSHHHPTSDIEPKETIITRHHEDLGEVPIQQEHWTVTLQNTIDTSLTVVCLYNYSYI